MSYDYGSITHNKCLIQGTKKCSKECKVIYCSTLTSECCRWHCSGHPDRIAVMLLLCNTRAHKDLLSISCTVHRLDLISHKFMPVATILHDIIDACPARTHIYIHTHMNIPSHVVAYVKQFRQLIHYSKIILIYCTHCYLQMSMKVHFTSGINILNIDR